MVLSGGGAAGGGLPFILAPANLSREGERWIASQPIDSLACFRRGNGSGPGVDVGFLCD